MSTSTWYYVNNGEQIGPVNIDEIKTIIRSGKITESTKVWNDEGDWKPASETYLSSLFPQPDPTIPPPLMAEDVDNKFMWMLVAVPVLGTIIDLIVGAVLILPSIIANITLCYFDEKKLKSAGHKAPTLWMIFIVPIYIWKRCTLLNHKKYYFGAWVCTFILSILLSIGGHQVVLEQTACPLVSDIIKKQLYGSAECMDVTIDKGVKPGFYKATATLDNGNELRITIKEGRNGKIRVKIPNQ